MVSPMSEVLSACCLVIVSKVVARQGQKQGYPVVIVSPQGRRGRRLEGRGSRDPSPFSLSLERCADATGSPRVVGTPAIHHPYTFGICPVS